MRLGLSCVVNRNRKVGANSPGASGTIAGQRRPCPWWGRGGEGGEVGEKQGLSCWRNALPSWMQEGGEAVVWACFREGKGKREPKARNPKTLNEKRFSAWVSLQLRISSLSRTWSRQRYWVRLVFLGSSTRSRELNGVFKSTWGLGPFKTANSWVHLVERWRMILLLYLKHTLGKKNLPQPLVHRVRESGLASEDILFNEKQIRRIVMASQSPLEL